MELKHDYCTLARPSASLLIVPYGIETWVFICTLRQIRLLIVPYGIETCLAPFVGIVRYGLLIVPYGIETRSMGNTVSSFLSFNRTLWN